MNDLVAEVAGMRSRFRILSGWDIRVEDDGENYGCCQVNWRGRSAVIRPFSDNPETKVPEHYVLHEVLHIVLGILFVVPSESMKEVQEGVVRDLSCMYLGEVVDHQTS